MPQPTPHILLVISSGNWIKANKNMEVKSRSLVTCAMCQLGFDVRLWDVRLQ
jgi:hypothetical protein